jgi:hypothetical protein
MQGLKKVLLLTKKMIMQEPFKEFKPLAERGDQEIQGYLAAMYLTRKGVPKDDTQAVHWFKKAAEQGNIEAQYYLAILFQKGQGVPKVLLNSKMLNVSALNYKTREISESI